jgi:FkbM family methyltransferase
MSIALIETHTILPDIISPGSTVVDCGANIGGFSLEMIKRYSCVCYAIEAAPETFRKIPDASNLRRYNFALCADNKPVAISIDEDTTRSTIKGFSNDKKNERIAVVQGRRLGEFLARELGNRNIDLVKMDIEGAEIEVIASLDDEFIRRVGQWTIEFHDFMGMSSAADVERCVERIAGLGFRELFWSKNRNNADVLLVNKNLISFRRYIVEQHVVRPVRASFRFANRIACRVNA